MTSLPRVGFERPPCSPNGSHPPREHSTMSLVSKYKWQFLLTTVKTALAFIALAFCAPLQAKISSCCSRFPAAARSRAAPR